MWSRTPPSAASNNSDTHLLTGILFDKTGERLSPSSTSNHGKRYRYYASSHLVRSPGHGRASGGEHETAEHRRHDKDKSDGTAASRDKSLGKGRRIGSRSGKDWRISALVLDRAAIDQLRLIFDGRVLISDWLRQHRLPRQTSRPTSKGISLTTGRFLLRLRLHYGRRSVAYFVTGRVQ
jgi:hypothetical protein